MRRRYYRNDIKRFRLTMNPAWLQEELARRSGCTQPEISAYERGTVMPSLETALRIARALGRVLEEVFFDLAEVINREVNQSRDPGADQHRGGHGQAA